VLVPAKFWTQRADDSWRRRVISMCLGVSVGLLALWLDGIEIPPSHISFPTTEERRIAVQPAPLPPGYLPKDAEDPRPHWYTGLVLNEEAVAACYLAYFGLAFFLIRWWKMADRRRKHRFSLSPVFGAAVGGWLLMLFLWPTGPHGRVVAIDRST